MRDGLADAIRTGIVSSINPAKCTAQVMFTDRKDAVSGDLPVLVLFTQKDRAYYMPAVGERVKVIFDPEAPSRGYILGSFYAENRKPPIADENKAYIMFEDNTLIEYDKKQHKLTINISEASGLSVSLETAGDISIRADGSVSVESKEDLILKGKTSSMTL